MMLQWSENAGLGPGSAVIYLGPGSAAVKYLGPGRKCGSSLAGKPDSSWEHPDSHPHHPDTHNATLPQPFPHSHGNFAHILLTDKCS